MPARIDLACKAGAAVRILCRRFKPRDITGWTLQLRVFDDRGGAVLLTLTLGAGITLTDATAGDFMIVLTATHTGTTLGAGSFWYDLWRTDSGSETPMAEGTLLVRV